MSRPTFTASISLGNILTILGMLLAVTAAWSARDGDIKTLNAQVSSSERRAITTESRIHDLEVLAAQCAAQGAQIRDTLADIRDRLKQLSANH